jgi:hypothetical protein
MHLPLSSGENFRAPVHGNRIWEAASISFCEIGPDFRLGIIQPDKVGA